MRYVVTYEKRCKEWDERSRPMIVDTQTGQVVLQPPQFVNHPGQYDKTADKICKKAVQALNGSKKSKSDICFDRKEAADFASMLRTVLDLSLASGTINGRLFDLVERLEGKST